MVAIWSNEDVALAVIIAWALWTNRNETQHGGMRKSTNLIFQWCIQYLDEYWSACSLPVKKPGASKKNWVPPTGLNYKVNVDGAVFSAQKAAGEQLKLRLMAFEVGIAFAGEIGMRDFVLEGDSLIMIQALCDSAPTPSSMASLVYGIAVVARDFRSVKFSHGYRNGNISAHSLAKHVLHIVNYCA
nr:hypothetical protein CFP56_76326 [Quercus suber]